MKRLPVIILTILLACSTVFVTRPVEAASLLTYDRPAHYGMGRDTDQTITMSDGVRLRADVYYPTEPGTTRRAAGSFPVLLQQTVYGKQLIQISGNFDPVNSGFLAPLGQFLGPLIGDVVGSISDTDVPYLVMRGYIVVVSDIRGTGQSEGIWDLLQDKEVTDGVAMVNWAARLPGSNGKVGLFGVSYMAMTAYLTMGALGPDSPVKAAFPIVAGHDLYRELFTQGGIPNVLFDYTIGLNTIPLLNVLHPALGPVLQAALNGDFAALARGIANLVPTELQHVRQWDQAVIPLVLDANFNGDKVYDESYWEAKDPKNALARVVANGVPVFEIGDWHDLFQAGSLRNYTALQNLAAGRPAEAPMVAGQPVSPRYQLLMGPWTHVTNDINVIKPLMLQWFDAWLYDLDVPIKHQQNPLHLNQVQTDSWHDLSTWPVQGGQATKFYLDPARAGTPIHGRNDGSLRPVPPTSSSAQRLPWLPFSSSCNQQTNQWWAGTPALISGLLGGAPIPCLTTGSDNDISLSFTGLTYTSTPFTEDKVIAGPITASLYASLSPLPFTLPSDVQLVTTVEALSPDGRRSLPLTNGALLGSHRAVDSAKSWRATNGELLLPHHPYTRAASRPVPLFAAQRYDVEVNPIFASIPTGWRLRVTVTSADTPHLFPTFSQFTKLAGGVYQVRDNPSFVNIPIFPASTFTTPCTLCP